MLVQIRIGTAFLSLIKRTALKEYNPLEGLEDNMLFRDNHKDVFSNSSTLISLDTSYLKARFLTAEGEEEQITHCLVSKPQPTV